MRPQASEAQAYPLQLATRVEAGEVGAVFRRVGSPTARRANSVQQLYEQGLKVYTTLDLDMQTAAERAMERQIRAIEAGRLRRLSARQLRALHRPRRATTTSDNSANSPYLQGAFIAMDPRTGGGSRARRRSRLRRQQVRSRRAVDSAARFDVQAVRLRRRHSEWTPAVVLCSTTRR